ncbi:TIGR01458 family HAD-type hydrolase [Spongiibacter taiwanensis]|uniref:TIGR01458 family HAD-type hydrolase n=1 Tax=Spongiibacter taiwanensis TaxID=1748242 RepID=UPI002036368E|nr:TIGR01458 family HAD-type hydrolase [Spongiibacter taiwanensis]USA41775.1 TIGR01458 family HAD-type hydrolase [Spongiibacter taiwanensis]
MVKGLLLDIGGVLTEDGSALPQALEGMAAVRKTQLPLRFLTNTSRRTARQVATELRSLGFELADHELVTAPLAVKQYLRAHQLRPLILATPELAEEFADLDSCQPNAVVVFDAGEGFTYAALNEAFQCLHSGAQLLAVGANRYFRSGGALQLDAGPFVKALEYAAACEATIIGKPAAAFYHSVVSELGLSPAEVMMVGDDVDSDVVGALDAGLQACLSRTGKFCPGDEQRVPGLPCIDRLGELVAHLDDSLSP